MAKKDTPKGFISRSFSRKLPWRWLVMLSGSRVPFRVETDNLCPVANDRPVIYSVNHSNSFDIPIAMRVSLHHPLVLLGYQHLSPLERLFFFLCGTIWVDRDDKEDMRRVKEDLMRLLWCGHSVLWFPEGTWNMSENLLMLPMKWGIIDVAQRSEARIIPVALDYDRVAMVCTVRFGAPMDTTGEDKREAIRSLRDAMATLRWELMSRRPVQERAMMDNGEEREALWQAVEEYSPLEWKKEESFIFQPYEKVEELPASLTPRKENAFLWSKHNHD